jgi:hypothetical protein
VTCLLTIFILLSAKSSPSQIFVNSCAGAFMVRLRRGFDGFRPPDIRGQVRGRRYPGRRSKSSLLSIPNHDYADYSCTKLSTVHSHVPMLVKEVNCPETSIRCPGTILELLGDALWTVERTRNGLCMDSGESTRGSIRWTRNPV